MIWIDEHDVLVLHGRLLADHGGATGLRDPGLLSSALARPKQHLAYGTEDVIELAAIYTAGLIQNHPFVDGNKRIGFLIGILFAELNGYRFTASQEQATTAVLALAAGQWKEAEYIGFLKRSCVQQGS